MMKDKNTFVLFNNLKKNNIKKMIIQLLIL